MAKADTSPDHYAMNNLIATLFIGALPHFVYQPFWVGLAFALMMGWRLMHNYRGWPLPAASRWLRVLHNGTAALVIVLIFGQFGLTIGRDAGAALLTIMLAFKVVETRSLRDYYLSCYLGYFLVITNFFYSQSMLMVILMLVVVLLLTACLISVNSESSAMSLKQRLKLSGKMVLQAIPVMLILFVLFPRISGPIWGLPQDAGSNTTTSMTEQITLGDLPQQSGSTGINDEIQMGKISQLIQSDEIAFRVEFENDNLPPTSDRYWRGPVLWKTDGTVWSPLAPGESSDSPPQIAVRGSGYNYTMTLEPHNKRWLFALDLPTEKPTGMSSYLSADARLNSSEAIKNRVQYSLQSYTDYRLNAAADPHLWAALQLPDGMHPRTRRLANEWKQQSENAQQYIDRVLAFFNQENFSYTLSPPVLQGDTVDQFLFESREGFCEHYAASFTILMRAADIPARIVTGYQGGVVNPVDNVLTVRQRDAHAWTEVWLPERGWVRIDPTSAVASERVERGMSDMLPAERNSPRMIAQSDALVKVWQDLRNNWNALNTAWDIWVVGYGPQIQKEFLSRLGMQNPDWRKMAAILTLLLALTGILMLLMSYYRHAHPDPAVRLYTLFCRKLARFGLIKQEHEGPLDFASRAQNQLPDYQQQIATITHLYTQLRYRHSSEALLSELETRIKQFQPRQ